ATPTSPHTTLRHQWMPYERYTYAWPPPRNIEALRAVRRLPNPCAAGSSWSYASTSTITPPTPSTYSCAPISSGATSCGLRVRSSVIVQELRQGERGHDAPGDAREPARDDRESE